MASFYLLSLNSLQHSNMIGYLIANHRNTATPTLQMSTCINKQPHIDNWKVAKSLARPRPRPWARNSEALCLLLWTSHLRSAHWEASGKDKNAQRHIPAHTANIPEIHRRYLVCLKDVRLSPSLEPAVSETNYKDSSSLSLLKVKVLAVLSGPAAESAHTRGRSHHSADWNRKTGRVDPGRKWEKNRKTPGWQ